jgi:hypothetical protein
LPDGVLMRTDRAWAIAGADGTLAVGDLPRQRCRKIPVLRVLTGLGPALLVGLRGGTNPRRHVPWPMIRGIVLAQLVVVGADNLAAAAHLSRRWSPFAGVAIFVLAIAVFRAATPTRQWRFHGAEHKAVAAHEHGVDLTDTPAVLACSRVHPRCGSNLVVWVALAAIWLRPLPWIAQLAATIAVIAVVAEIIDYASRAPNRLPSRLALAPGLLLQRAITTSEPTPSEQQVGCRALSACLARHDEGGQASAPTPALREIVEDAVGDQPHPGECGG